MFDAAPYELFIGNINEAIRVVEKIPVKHLHTHVVRANQPSAPLLTAVPIALAFDGYFMDKGFAVEWVPPNSMFSRGYYALGSVDNLFGDQSLEYFFAQRMHGVLDTMGGVTFHDDKELTLFRLHTRRAEFDMAMKMQRKLFAGQHQHVVATQQIKDAARHTRRMH